MNDDSLVSLRDVSFSWSHRGGKTLALDNCSLEIENNSTHFVCGPSGSGKSTLALLLAKLIEPSSGEIQFDNRLSSRESISIVFQFPENLFIEDTVEDELKSFGNTAASQGREIIKQLGLSWESLRDKIPQNLSEGTARLFAIALQAARKPRLLILDEPTLGLDFAHRIRLIRFLKAICEQDSNLIIVTHDLRLLKELNGTTLLMMNGKIGWKGRVGGLLENKELLKQYSLQ